MRGLGRLVHSILSYGTDTVATPPVAGLLDRLEAAEGLAGYAWIVLGTVAGGVGVPIPEEAVLGVAGWMASAGRISLVAAYAIGWTCIVGWDLVLHDAGRRLGPRLEASRFGRRIGERRWAAARGFFARHGILAVAAARFVMGSRITVFVLAGASGMPRGRFLAVVAPLALVSCAWPLALGYALGREAQRWIADIRGVQLAVLGLAALVLAVLAVRHLRRRPAAGPEGVTGGARPSPGGTPPSGPPTKDRPPSPGTR